MSLLPPPVKLSIITASLALIASLGVPSASAQNVFYAGIAYSQSTGKIGFTVRQARTERDAQALAARNCGEEDAKTFIWGPNQWVAIAVIPGRIGTAGFGRGDTSEIAQAKALAECKKRADGAACRVALCIHSQGMRPRELRSLPADRTVPPPAPPSPQSDFYAAIAFSPSTGKVGHTAGKARTKEEAQKLALADCKAKDARVFMWGNQWVAVAVCDTRPGIAGFGPGATRQLAEKQALAECRKLSSGAPCRIALAVHSSGKEAEKLAQTETADNSSGERSRSVVRPAAARTPQPPAEQAN